MNSPPIIIFDGMCGLCKGSVKFIIKRDRPALFRFAPLQSDTGREICRRHGIDADRLETIVLVEADRAFMRSAAAVRIARRLDGPWKAAAALWLVPRPIRDWLYDVVARNRVRWFERQTECWRPGPELADRFID